MRHIPCVEFQLVFQTGFIPSTSIMAGTGVNILVNDFMFCAAHGSEFCLVCFCDHRMCNNIRVEDELSNMSELFLDLDFDIEVQFLLENGEARPG